MPKKAPNAKTDQDSIHKKNHNQKRGTRQKVVEKSAKQKQMHDFLNRKRKMDLKVEKEPEPSTSSEPSNAEPVDVEEAKKEKQKYEKVRRNLEKLSNHKNRVFFRN